MKNFIKNLLTNVITVAVLTPVVVIATSVGITLWNEVIESRLVKLLRKITKKEGGNE